MGHIEKTNIPFHLEHMVKYIKQEEEEEQSHHHHHQASSGTASLSLTGPCLELLIQRRMLEQMVGWAEIDVPSGMRITVLKTFSLLLMNVNQRILPEGAVRVPLERLIRFCHELVPQMNLGRVSGQSAGSPRLGSVNAKEERLELMRLVHVVFRQLDKNPALLNLFLIEHQPPKSPTKSPVVTSEQDPSPISPGTNMKQQQPSLSASFYLLDFVLEFLVTVLPNHSTSSPSTPLEEMDAKTATLARETLLTAVGFMSQDDRFTNYLVNGSGLCKRLVELLGGLFVNMLDERLERHHETDGQVQQQQVINMNTASDGKKSGSLEESSGLEVAFFEAWNLINDLMVATATSKQPLLNHLPASPSSASSGQKPHPGLKLRSQLIHTLMSQFFSMILLPRLSQTTHQGASKYNQLVLMEYFAGMVQEVRDEECMASILSFLFATPNKADTSAANKTSLRDLLVKRATSRNEQLNLATWKVFDALLDSYSHVAYDYLVLSELSPSAQALTNKNVEDDGKLVERSYEIVNEVLARMLDWAASVDEKWAASSNPQSPSNPPADQPPRSPSPFSPIIGNASSAMEMGDLNASVGGIRLGAQSRAISVVDMQSRNYDLYFTEAQERNQVCFFAYQSWKNHNQPAMSPMNTSPTSQTQTKSSPTLVSPNSITSVSTSTLGSIHFLDLVLKQLVRFYFNSPKKNLVLTSIIGKIAHLPHRGVQNWILNCASTVLASGSTGEEEKFGLFLQGSAPSVVSTLYGLYKQSGELIQGYDEFDDKLRVIRKYCRDDVISILHNFANSSGTADGVDEGPETDGEGADARQRTKSALDMSVVEFEKALIDHETHGVLGSNTPAPRADSAPTASTTFKSASGKPTFSTFLPAYLILAEFTKELSAILFLVHRSMDMVDQMKESAMELDFFSGRD